MINTLGMPVIADNLLLGIVVATAGPQGCKGIVYVHGDGHFGDAEYGDLRGYYHLVDGVRTWTVDWMRLDALVAASQSQP